MAQPVLDINDASLGLWRNGELGLSSPGYALLEGDDYSFGEAARAQARRRPREINHRYWSQLDTEPLNPAFGPGRHTADLVHSHLLAIHAGAGRPDEVIIAAPGSLQYDQLALLLGIAEQCPFRIAGLCDRAVAATASHTVGEYNWHVELQLNQALLTGMRYEQGQLIRDNMVPIPGSGWIALQDCLARSISEAFVRQTRFDPRRAADVEQALYDKLPLILEKLRLASETNVDLEGRQARIERSSLAEACDSHYQRILRTITAGDARLFLGPTLSGLPGLAQLLPAAVHCEPQAVSTGIIRHRDRVLADDSGIHFITSLPAEGDAPSTESKPKPVAEKIAATRCQMDFNDGTIMIEPVAGPAPALNGERLSGPVCLGDGDLLELPDGTAWKFVAVRQNRNHGE